MDYSLVNYTKEENEFLDFIVKFYLYKVQMSLLNLQIKTYSSKIINKKNEDIFYNSNLVELNTRLNKIAFKMMKLKKDFCTHNIKKSSSNIDLLNSKLI